MNELFAGYANYASTEAILEERLTAGAQQDVAQSSISVSVTLTVTYSWSWTW